MVISGCRLQSSKHKNCYVQYEEMDGLPVYRWSPNQNSELRMSKQVSLYTVQELRNIHRRTGHPSARRLMNILESSPNSSDLPRDTRSMLIRIEKSCRACQLYTKAPESFRFVIKDDARFNHEVLVDIFTLSDGNVLHIICTGTKYQLGVFLNSASSKSCWEAIRSCWINILSGAPNTIKADAGRQFDSKEFRGSARAEGIPVDIIPTEVHHKIGLLERYHKIVRQVYEKLKIDDPTMSRELRLSTTFRC
eukprot:IDg11974t1